MPIFREETVVVGEIIGTQLHIRLWLMSCRMLKREIENVMINALVEQAVKYELYEIIGYYYPTEKNRMVRDFYQNMSFEKILEEESGSSKWRLKVDEFEKRISYGKVVNQLL